MHVHHRRPAWWVLMLAMTASLAVAVPAAASASAAPASTTAQTAGTASSSSTQLAAAVQVAPAGSQPADPVLARRIAQVSRYVHVTGGQASLDPAIYTDPRIDAATRTWAAQRVAAYPYLYRLVHTSAANPASAAGRTQAGPQAQTCILELDVYWWGGVYFIADKCAAKRIAAVLGSAAALSVTLLQLGVPAPLVAPFIAYFAIYGLVFSTEADTCPNGIAGWAVGPVAIPYCA